MTRGGYTVAEQSAWVDNQCAELKFDADKATVVREAAQDRLRVLLAQPRSSALWERACDKRSIWRGAADGLQRA